MIEEKDKHDCCDHDHHDHDHEHHHHHDGECECHHHHHDDEHEHVHRGGCPCCHHDDDEEEELTKGRLAILICRLAVGLILAFLGLFLWNEQNLRGIGLSDVAALWVNFAVMVVAYLAVGYDILWKTIKHFRHIKDLFDENTLMTIATIGAFCLRFFGEQQNEFFEAVMVVFLYQVGELFEDISVDRSKKAIEDAVGLRAKKACLLHEGKKEEVDPETLKIGDQILVDAFVDLVFCADADDVLGYVVMLFFHYVESVPGCTAKRAFFGCFITFVYITADRTYKFLHFGDLHCFVILRLRVASEFCIRCRGRAAKFPATELRNRLHLLLPRPSDPVLSPRGQRYGNSSCR